jgi:VIT1/CCC1 family predicted Fe2+/Mn2+ transporter
MPLRASQRIAPDTIRNIFVGLNDGLVGTLGSIIGFFAAFHNPVIVFAATLIESTAATFSMSAGSYVAVDSETESRALSQAGPDGPKPRAQGAHPLRAAITVGLSYILGATVTASPLLFGARTSLPCWITAGLAITGVSYVVARAAGMNVRKRIVFNVCILAATACVTYFVGELAHRLFNTRM